MRLSLQIAEDGKLRILVGGEPWLWDIGPRLLIKGTWHGEDELSGDAWTSGSGEDTWGKYRSWERIYRLEEEPFLRLVLREYETHILLRAEVLRDLAGLRPGSFACPTFLVPAFRFPERLEFLLTTFGLGSTPGGYWPKALLGRGPGELPNEAFAPLVLFSEAGALAISPGNFFLTSVLTRIPGGAARGLLGTVDELRLGTSLETLFVGGRDLSEALMRLGDLLLARSEKPRASFKDHPLLSSLGYWNAYGSYYTELINPFREEILRNLAAEFRAKRIPVGYVGLDLWYPYSRIGQALVFRPDEKKYPRGLHPLRKELGIPFVLHLSALSQENLYHSKGDDPEVYETVAADIVREGGIGVWHDWLRTWQWLTPALMQDPERAEAWFSGMAQAFRAAGLPVLLCMQTMGMVLGSTKELNIVAARSYTDHLFSLPMALRRASRTDPHILREEQRPVDIWRQNLILGFVQWAFGLAPFHDLFLSRWHPGFGGERAWEEAVMRALSCGPVGFGDACGMADRVLLSRLVLPEGKLAQPARPPEPLWPTLRSLTPVFWAETKAGELTWIYMLALNLGDEPQRIRLEPPKEGNFLVWDPQKAALTSAELTVPPGGLAYRVFIPRVAEAGFLGIPHLLVPMPEKAGVEAWIDGGKLKVSCPQSLPLHMVFEPNKMVPAESWGKARVQRR